MRTVKDFYEEATQVKFTLPDEDDTREIGGIAYKNFIICGECGGVCLIRDVIITEELPWCPISEEIIGN